jgi:hypothetical protein
MADSKLGEPRVMLRVDLEFPLLECAGCGTVFFAVVIEGSGTSRQVIRSDWVNRCPMCGAGMP